mgnify:CR=1 FL=1
MHIYRIFVNMNINATLTSPRKKIDLGLVYDFHRQIHLLQVRNKMKQDKKKKPKLDCPVQIKVPTGSTDLQL